MSTKTILIFTDWYSPAYKAGGPISSLVNLVNLLQKHYKFFIVTGDRDLGSNIPFANIQTNQWVDGENNEAIFYCHQSNLSKTLIQDIIETTKPNYIYYNSLFSVNFTLKPLLFLRKNKTLSFLSPRGMLHPKAFSQKRFKKRLFVALSRLSKPFKSLTFIATNETEKKHIEAAGYANKTFIAPNIPDFSLFKIKAPCTKTITIVSRIAEEKNSIGAIKSLSLLQEKVTVNWFGEGITKNYETRFLDAVKQLPKNIDLVLHGAKPKKIIQSNLSGVFFLPTFGENFGHAIFEALAAGMPSVIGINTPFAHVESFGAGYALEPNNYKVLAEKLSVLLTLDNLEYEEKSAHAKSFAQSFFNKSEHLKIYQMIWS